LLRIADKSDPLSALLERFRLTAGTFFSGRICGTHPFDRDAIRGHLHVIKRGPVELIDADGASTSIDRPSLIFFPQADPHRLVANDALGADVVCASVQFGGGEGNPIARSLPASLLVPLDELRGADALIELLFEEAFSERRGRVAALDRLCELLVLHLLRHCLENGLANGGLMAGFSDDRLAKAIGAVQEDPARRWTLPQMAAIAGMSRARFAARFRDITGQTPGAFVVASRMSVAQTLLRAGRPLKKVVDQVGYANPKTFTRAFSRELGTTPIRWSRYAARSE